MTYELLSKQTLKTEKPYFDSVLSAIVEGIKQSNVKVVYNYPGRPATLLIDLLKEKAQEIDIQDYLPNEFVAAAKAFGSSVIGCERSLVVFKDVGTNVACDHFYCLNHIGINRGLVFFIGDDPSAWYSQNEEDSRGIYFNAELPFFEPNDPYTSFYSVKAAYELSEMFRLPFFIRTTGKALKTNFSKWSGDLTSVNIPFAENVVDIPFDALDKWKSIFSTVEEDREELLEKHKKIVQIYEKIGLNIVKGSGNLGIIASGFPATQLELENLVSGVSLLKLVTVYPLPEKTIIEFLKNKERVLIVDQGEPLLELLIRDCAHRNKINIPILGKLNGFVRQIGEYRDNDLKLSVEALKLNRPPEKFPPHEQIAIAPALKKDDGYLILLDCLREAVKQTGVRPLYCGDAGQPSQIADTPGYDDLLHMETTMGCSVAYLAGGIEAYKRSNSKMPFKGIAYVGDSNFFHSSLPGILEAAAKDHPILMLLVDNQGAVSTGKQSHIGMKINDSIKQISARKILETADIQYLEETSIKNKNDLTKKLINGIKHNGFAVVIVHTE